MNIHFNEQEYEKDLMIIDIPKAGKIGMVITIPTFLIFGVLFYLFHKDVIVSLISTPVSWGMFAINIFKALVIYIFGIVLHELIHGITWALFLKDGFKSIKFGIIREYLTPYCHSKGPMKIKHYLLGAIMPAIVLGIVPAVLGVILGNLWLTIFGVVFTTAAIGDFMVINFLKNENMNHYAQDHPSEAGCYVYRMK